MNGLVCIKIHFSLIHYFIDLLSSAREKEIEILTSGNELLKSNTQTSSNFECKNKCINDAACKSGRIYHPNNQNQPNCNLFKTGLKNETIQNDLEQPEFFSLDGK